MKKILSIVLACVMLLGTLSMVGCGSTSDSEAGVIKIGGTGPLTGGAAIYGNAAKNGAQIAVDEINALADAKIKFELKYEDDQHDPEKAVNAFNTLMDWGMQVSLGSVTSKPAVATSQEASDIFYLTPSASSTDVLGGVANPLTGTVEIERKSSIFQMCFMDPAQGLASAQYISDKQLGEKIAVIYKNDDVYSTGIYNTFNTKAEELGLNIVSVTTFTDDTSTDFSAQIADAKNAGADLVFLPMYYEAASLILIQAKQAGYEPKYFGVDGMDGILTLDGFDTTLAEGVMLLTPFNADATDELTVKFVNSYKEKYGEVPNQFAADAYDCVYAIYNALKDKDVTSESTPEEIRDILVSTFTSDSFTYSGLTGQNMTWDDTGAVSKSPKGMIIKDGAYVGLDD